MDFKNQCTLIKEMEATTPTGWTALHEAAKMGSLEDVERLLEESDVVVDAKDSNGDTPFAIVCRVHDTVAFYRYLEIMKALLKAGANAKQVRLC